MNYSFDTWTYGAELEWSDFDSRKGLPGDAWKYDTRDFTMVNSNGIAVDPKHKTYPFGGELNVPPAHSVGELKTHCQIIRDWFPDATVNYRSNLHIHVGVPDLWCDLEAIKKIQRYVDTELRGLIDAIEPIPRPHRIDFASAEEYKGACRRYNRRRVSHHTFVPHDRVERQLKARTLEEFFEAEVPRTKAGGKPMWHAQPRACVNLRQLKETGTIEFRHFPGTTSPQEIFWAAAWCEMFLIEALGSQNPLHEVLRDFCNAGYALPKFPAYDHACETRYRLTCHDGTVSKDEIVRNQQLILEGKL